MNTPNNMPINNTSGIVGVRIFTSYDRFDREYKAWQASGRVDGVSWTKTFGINKFGEKEAFKLACQARFDNHGPLQVSGKLNQFPARIPVEYTKVKRQ